MLEVENFTKDYGDLRAVNALSFQVEEGDFVTLLGPSGCGKSTTLHAIAGLIEPTEGRIHLRGTDVTDLPPEERNIGMAFQSTALFPHMTVRENIAYGLRMHGYGDEELEARVDESLELVDMPEHGDHKPAEISGGQQSRVSLARALAYEPDILLLDEPLTGLDRVLREEMRSWLSRIQHDLGVTTLYVTHDQEDALSMSDEVVVLNNGESQQIAPPEEIYETPENSFVAEFVGKSTQFAGTVDVSGQRPTVSTGSLDVTVTGDHEAGEQVSLFVRPEDVSMHHDPPGDEPNTFEGTIREIANLGDRAEVVVELADGTETLVHTERFPDVAIGDRAFVSFPPASVIVL